MNAAEISIREAEEDDLPDVLALYGQPALDDGKVLQPEEAAAIFAQFARYPHYKLYVATWDSRIVGTYALLVMHNLGHLGAPSAIAEDVVVDATCQGQGIGAAMMRHAMAQARKARCYKLALSSNAMRVRAHEFYEKLGFERHGFSFVVALDGRDTAS
jgi:GNAT superfamily N-acetyltransferase